MWEYKSPIGSMYIRKNKLAKYDLIINDNVYGQYKSPVAAADDVYTFTTGCDEWDSKEDKYEDIVPTDINEWQKY